ncbi:hypothetical protein ULMS_09250 [Patiriisocius marinistellae]|uniref:META domain-containing protein n=1 Tax=Patiriisocius marinistellae TaxID=2494560 RepID=A0A5J4FSX1_9FLAO|nr:DUF4377 domain-containing protein [Patiriisocius marinistellae]GEQ85417.1 hypothetical protein ULMS_09250 [Patiriisocius marinistellae]
MRLFKIFAISIVLVMLQSCTTYETEVMWVSGAKTTCDAGAGKMQCLKVYKGEDINNPKWENFYAGIEGFEFEEGFLKKIEVKYKPIEDAPADASSIKYIFVKELEKREDFKSMIEGDWIGSRIKNNPIHRGYKLPQIQIESNEMLVSGMGGCNNYNGEIKNLTNTNIEFGNIVSTKMACINRNVEREYFETLNTVNTYKIEENTLSFFNAEGKEVMYYVKKTTPSK